MGQFSLTFFLVYEPVREKTICVPDRSDTNWSVQSQKTARSLKVWISKVEELCNIRVVKTKALISYAVTAKLICIFIFACADCWFSDALALAICIQNDILELIFVILFAVLKQENSETSEVKTYIVIVMN